LEFIMNDAVRKGRRLTDIDLFDLSSPPSSPYTPELDWQNRPLVVYSVRRDEDYVIKGRDKYQERGAFLREIGQLGHKPTDVIDIQPDASIAPFHWRRNLSWRSLPLIEAPAYQGGWCPRMVMDDAGMQRGATAKSPHLHHGEDGSVERSPIINASTKVLVVADYVRSDRTLFEVSAVAGRDVADVALMHFDGSRLEPIAPTEIAELQRHFSAHERFVFNHALNLFVIGGRAWVKAAREHGYTQQHVEYYVPKPGSIGWRSVHPLALQVLYALHSSGAVAMEQGKSAIYDLLKSPSRMADALQFFRIEGGRFIFEWKGSGRYSSWFEDLGEYDVEVEWEREWNGVVHILSDLVLADLIGCAGTSVALTSLGHRFLELIGDEADDPDVLLRWRTADGRLGAPEDVPAMDRWLNRAFRAIKRKVNGLSASPPTEAVEHAWPPAPKNVIHARGYSIPLSAEMLSDPDVDALLQEFARHEDADELRKRECGIIRAHRGFGEMGAAEGLWIGIPLGVYDTNQQSLAKLDALRDWRSFDERVSGLAARFAETKLAPWLIGEPSLIEAGRTADDHVVFTEPGILAEPDTDAPVSLVIKGIVLPIEDLRNETHELRQLIGLQRLGASVVKITDGVRVTGSGSKVAVSWGMLAGRLNHKTNEFVLQTTFNASRSSGVERVGRLAPLMALALDHPNLSKDGYWMISPDGSVTEIHPQ
jgi:hypothetical protein